MKLKVRQQVKHTDTYTEHGRVLKVFGNGRVRVRWDYGKTATEISKRLFIWNQKDGWVKND